MHQQVLGVAVSERVGPDAPARGQSAGNLRPDAACLTQRQAVERLALIILPWPTSAQLRTAISTACSSG